jgi:hypothetical protein
MPADCACGVVAVGRCVQCGDAFCTTHRQSIAKCVDCYARSRIAPCVVCGTGTDQHCARCSRAACIGCTAVVPAQSGVVNLASYRYELVYPNEATCDLCLARDRRREASLPWARIQRTARALAQAGAPGAVEGEIVRMERVTAWPARLFASRRTVRDPAGPVWLVGDFVVRNRAYDPDSRNGGPEQLKGPIVVTPTGQVRWVEAEKDLIDDVLDLERVARNLEAIAERHAVVVPGT